MVDSMGERNMFCAVRDSGSAEQYLLANLWVEIL